MAKSLRALTTSNKYFTTPVYRLYVILFKIMTFRRVTVERNVYDNPGHTQNKFPVNMFQFSYVFEMNSSEHLRGKTTHTYLLWVAFDLI
jgi:hypothetical protein